MLNEILNYLNNYFADTDYSFETACTFTASDTIAGDFADTFIVGEYILIEGSRVNDGVYLIKAIDGTSITIDLTVDYVITTEPETTMTLTKCYIPQDLISLIAEINTFNANSTDGIASESQGQRSVSYVSGGNGTSGWINAFSPRLSIHKKLRWC